MGPSEFEIYCLWGCSDTGAFLVLVCFVKAEPATWLHWLPISAACMTKLCKNCGKENMDWTFKMGSSSMNWRAVSFIRKLFLLGCDKVGRQRNCIQVCQRAERGAVFSLLIGWVFPPSQIVLDRFSWLCTACFKKLMLSVSRFEVERKEVVLSGQLIWLESNYPL